MSNLTYSLCFLLFPAIMFAQIEGGQFSGSSASLPMIELFPDASTTAYLGPLVGPSGVSLFFSQQGQRQNIGVDNLSDIWVSYQQSNGQWCKAINIGAPVNNRLANQIVGISSSEDTLFIAENWKALGFSTQQGRRWSNPKPMTILGRSNWAVIADMHVSADGRVLLFSALTDKQDFDLFFSRRLSPTTWGKAQPLGPEVNTTDNEQSIYLAYDGKTIYFSRDGANGFGGQDVYRSKRLDQSWMQWSTPENLGASLNTEANEWALTVDASGKRAYLSREMPEGIGQLLALDLPKQLRPEPATVLKGRLLGEVVPAEVAIAISSVGEEERPRTITVAADGTYQAIIPQGIDVSLSANAEGFFSESNSIALSGDVLEELDYDPSMLTASLEQDETYLKRNEEIQLLQLKLSSLNDNLEAVQQERAAYQEQIAKERAQFEAAGGVLPRISDPELDALAHQYHNYLYNKEEKESFQAETTKVEYLNDTLVPPNETKQAVHDDDELEQLRKRFQAYRDQKTDAEPFVWDQPASYEQVSSIPEPSAQQTIKGVSTNNQAASKGNEQQLKEELAQGFNRNKDRTSAKEDWEKDLEEELVKPLEVVDQKYELIQKDVEAVREELDQKIQQQIEMEQGLGLPTTTTPPLLMDTTYNKITPKQSIEKNIELRPVAVGEVITINTIFFKPNTAEVKTISATEVARLAAFLQTNPALIVEIGVHTNGWVSHYQAMKLSDQRAQTLVQMLIEKGIASERLQAKGYGKSKPIADNETIEGRRANQRVELTILAR